MAPTQPTASTSTITPSYPDLSIKDDWNARAPKPVASFYDDVVRSQNEPTLGQFHDPETGEYVETSAGAVPADSDTAKAARDVFMQPSDAEDESVEDESVEDESAEDESVEDEFGTSSDPANFNADVVVAYLKGDISPEERERVIEAEKAGKNRTSIVNA